MKYENRNNEKFIKWDILSWAMYASPVAKSNSNKAVDKPGSRKEGMINYLILATNSRVGNEKKSLKLLLLLTAHGNDSECYFDYRRQHFE